MGWSHNPFRIGNTVRYRQLLVFAPSLFFPSLLSSLFIPSSRLNDFLGLRVPLPVEFLFVNTSCENFLLVSSQPPPELVLFDTRYHLQCAPPNAPHKPSRDLLLSSSDAAVFSCLLFISALLLSRSRLCFADFVKTSFFFSLVTVVVSLPPFRIPTTSDCLTPPGLSTLINALNGSHRMVPLFYGVSTLAHSVVSYVARPG